MLEHGAYTLLLDAYYDRERPPTKEEALAWTWARNDEETAAVEFVLSRFFEIDGNVYRQRRVDEEIDKYKANSLINKRIAKDREKKKREKKARTVHAPSTNEHEPPPNHKPLTINQEPNKTHTSSADEGFDEFWTIYPKKVEKKKAREIWKRRKLWKFNGKILDDIKTRIDIDQKWKDGYIPNPTTYLNGDRWEDEITEVRHEKSNRPRRLSVAERATEARKQFERQCAEQEADV